jgi:hypothetical protein
VDPPGGIDLALQPIEVVGLQRPLAVHARKRPGRRCFAPLLDGGEVGRDPG